MFKHTMASINIIKNEAALLSYIANIVSALFMMGYLIFASALGRGLLAVNITLCVLTAANFIIYLVTRKKCSKESKRVRKISKHTYNISRIILNAIPLGSLLYILAFTSEEISRIEMVLLPVLILIWLAQVVFEISSIYIQSRFTLFANGIEMDIENVIKPLIKIRNAVSGTDGENAFDISERNRNLLGEKVEKNEEKNSESSVKEEIIDKLSKTRDKIKELIKR